MKPITKNPRKLPDVVGAVARQGDVLLTRIATGSAAVGDEVPRDSKSGCVLALGEATGHHHHVPKSSARLFRAKTGDDRILTLKEGAKLLHEEHYPIYLPPGDYRVEIQREYSPMELRNVAD